MIRRKKPPSRTGSSPSIRRHGAPAWISENRRSTWVTKAPSSPLSRRRAGEALGPELVEHHDPRHRLRHAGHLGENPSPVRRDGDYERQVDGVEARVGEPQRLRVHPAQLEAAHAEPVPPPAGAAQHAFAEVHAGVSRGRCGRSRPIPTPAMRSRPPVGSASAATASPRRVPVAGPTMAS